MFHEYSESGPTLLGNPQRKIRGSFRLAPSNHIVANALRRETLVNVPTVGFRTEPYENSDVVIQTNTTPLVNEMLAHRIGMIPICADPATFDPARYEFHIHKENTGKEILDVHASDFVIVEKDPEHPLAEGTVLPSTTFFPPDPITGDTCLITRLRPQWNPTAPNEKLVLKAKAVISNGKENIRWSPVSQCSFENTLDDTPERLEAMFHDWLSESKKIPDVTVLSSERLAELQREYNTMERQRCFRVSPETGEANDFTFFIESIGVLSVPDCVRYGIDALIAMFEKYQDMDGQLPDTVRMQHANKQFPCVEFIFKNETYTLGTLLQYYLIELFNEGTQEPRILSAGFNPMHPLVKEVKVEVGVNAMDDPEMELQTARLAIAKTCRHIKSLFESMKEEWAGLFQH